MVYIAKNIIAAGVLAPVLVAIAAPAASAPAGSSAVSSNAPASSSAPAQSGPVPSNASRLAVDDNGNIVAYDASGKEIGTFSPPKSKPQKRDSNSPTCQPLSSDDVQKLKGWDTLSDQAKKNWGGGSNKVVTNDPDYPSQPAQVCVPDDTVNFQYDDDPTKSCQKSTNQADGQLQNGTITLTNQETSSTKGTTEVTQSTTLGTSASFGVKVGLEGIADVSSEFSTSIDITNSLSQTSEVSQSSSVTQTITQPVADGESDCHIELQTTSCQVTGTSNVPMVAQGWVWWEYDSKTDGHYKWALNMADVLPNTDDRSETMQMKYTGQVSANGNFTSTGCQAKPSISTKPSS